MLVQDSSLQVTYRGRTKSFFLSANVKPDNLQLLLRKAFRIQDRIKSLSDSQGRKIALKNVMRQCQRTNDWTLTLELDEDNEQNNRIVNQRPETRQEIRGTPPKQNDLPNQRYFIEDFQSFQSELTGHLAKTLIGIVFFDSVKDAKFLGRKILRQLVYQYGEHLRFYYSLYPSKIHTGSNLLGRAIIFSIYLGKHIISERTFPMALNAIDEISYIVKNMINSGEMDKKIRQKQDELSIKENSIDKSRKDNWNEQNAKRYQLGTTHLPKTMTKNASFRSVQPQPSQPEVEERATYTPGKGSPIKNSSLENSPHRHGDTFDGKPITTANAQQTKVSHLNEISFEQHTQKYPQWFSAGDTFTILEKGAIVNLINTNNQQFLRLYQSLNFSSPSRKNLNIQLLKVLIQENIQKQLSQFNQQEREHLEDHLNVRNNIIFSQLLKFQKLGSWQVLKTFLHKHFKELFKPADMSYTSIVRKLTMAQPDTSFKIKLFSNAEEDGEGEGNDETLLGKNPIVMEEIRKMTNIFHYSDDHFRLETVEAEKYRKKLEKNFQNDEIEKILGLLRAGDPFVIKQLEATVVEGEAAQRLKKLLRNKKYQGQLLDELQSPSLRPIRKKIAKFGNFKSLISYLYQFKRINKRQRKLFGYLYVWQDINVLGAFQAYSASHDLQDFVETVYIIDQIYYSRKKYGLELSEIEKFGDLLEHQLQILFTHKQQISLENRLALQKLARAGDMTIIKMYRQAKGNKKADFLKNLNEYAEAKRGELEELQNARKGKEYEKNVEKEEHLRFLQQIIPIHIVKKAPPFKPEHVYECLEKQEKILQAIFEAYDKTNDLNQWIQNFILYLSQLPRIHSRVILGEILKSLGCTAQIDILNRMIDGGNTLLLGVYQLHLLVQDRQETQDSLKRIFKIK